MAEEITEEFELNEVDDTIHGCMESRMSLFSKEFGPRKNKFDRSGTPKIDRDGYTSFVINPNTRWYRIWRSIVLMWSIYSTFFTLLEFGFFRGLPQLLVNLDSVQIIFIADVILQFFVAHRDAHSYKMVYDRRIITQRYLRGNFAVDILGCFPWDAIYKETGSEAIRFLVWVRIFRARNINEFFKKMEKDVRISYLFTRIAKLITVEFYCMHTAACVFYYLATTLPPEQEGYTWIGSLSIGDYHYVSFREMNFWRRYVTSLYFAFVTMATVGYGDIHAVNSREMVFVMIYISFTMVLGAYLIGNMTALIVKGSKTERFRDRMTELTKYMNRNKLGKDIRSQITRHLLLQYESSSHSSSILGDIPVAVRSKISQTLHIDVLQKVPLFKGCSDEFFNQIASKLEEEIFPPGEVILEQGSVVDQLYIILHGCLEEIAIGQNGHEEIIAGLVPYDAFGEIAVLYNIPQPCSIRVNELCRLLRIEKQYLTNTLQVYFKDGHQILRNLLKGKESQGKNKQLENDIAYLIAKQEAEQTLAVINAVYYRDIQRLKLLINAGADPNRSDYDGRTALHIATNKGYGDIVRFLIQRGSKVNCIDKFGNSPLLEALKAGHDTIANLLVANGAMLNLDDAGQYLCKLVLNGKIDTLQRLLEYGVDANSKTYDQRTPLHIASSEGLHLAAKTLIENGANVLSKDRWGKTPLDEGIRSGNGPLIQILNHSRRKQG